MQCLTCMSQWGRCRVLRTMLHYVNVANIDSGYRSRNIVASPCGAFTHDIYLFPFRRAT